LEFVAQAIRQEEEIKGVSIGKEEVKLSLFADNMLKSKRPEKLHQKTPRFHKIFSRVAGYKINLQILVVFLYTNNEQIEKEYRKTRTLKAL
jgi:hypothetical protein